MTANHIPSGNGDAVRGGRPVLWTVLGTLLGLVLLYASTRKVDATTLIATLRSADPIWAIGALVTTVGFVSTKARRWGILLHFIPDLKFGRLLRAVYAGLAVNFLISHVGEFLRAVLIARGSRVSVSAVFATVVVERVLDFVALLVLLALLTIFASNLPEFVEMAGVMIGGFVVIAVAGLYALLHPPQWLIGLITRVCRSLPKGLKTWFLNQFERSREGLFALQNLRVMAIVLAVSVVQWLFVVGQIVTSVIAVGEAVTIVSVATTFVLIVLGLSLPNAPMQVGTTQLAFVIGLSTAGTTATNAIAASLVYTLFSIVPTTIIGGICMFQGRRTVTTKLS